MKNGSALTIRAPARCWTSAAKAESKSAFELAFKTPRSSPSPAAANCVSLVCGSAFVLFGFTSKAIDFGYEIAQQFKSLRPQFDGKETYTGNIFTRPVKAGHKTGLDRIAANRENDRNRRGRRLG